MLSHNFTMIIIANPIIFVIIIGEIVTIVIKVGVLVNVIIFMIVIKMLKVTINTFINVNL